LPIGVLGVRGEFNPGDAVRLVAADGSEIGRGLSRLGAMDSFDLSTAGADLTECEEDADCTVVELSSDCGNGCVAAVVSTSAAGGIVDALEAHPERRCSACAVLLEAGSELAIYTSCSAEAAPPACVDGRCRRYHTL
jgi:hypothetical protein